MSANTNENDDIAMVGNVETSDTNMQVTDVETPSSVDVAVQGFMQDEVAIRLCLFIKHDVDLPNEFKIEKYVYIVTDATVVFNIALYDALCMRFKIATLLNTKM